MAQQRKDVVFRRVRGRVVPIRVREGAKEIAAGAGIATAGGLAAGASIYAPDAYFRNQKDRLVRALRYSKTRQAPITFRNQPTFDPALLGRVKKPKPSMAYRVGKKLHLSQKVQHKISQGVDSIMKKAPKLGAPLYLSSATVGGAFIGRGISRAAGFEHQSKKEAVAMGAGSVAAFGLSGVLYLRAAGVPTKKAFWQTASIFPDLVMRARKYRMGFK